MIKIINKMIVKRKNVNIFLLAVFCILNFSLCSPEPRQESGTGAVMIFVNENGARTILPGTDKNDFFSYINSYRLIFHTAGTQDNHKIVTCPANEMPKMVHLDAGHYKLIITACTDTSANNPAARGEMDLHVIAGTLLEETVILQAIGASALTGSFTWDITFPFFLENASMQITPLSPSGSTPAAQNLLGSLTAADTFPASNNGILNNLASGYYSVVFTLKKDNISQPVTWRESLHVYQNMISRFEYEFTEEHFTENKRTVTLNYNGADGINALINIDCLRGAVVTAPSIPVRTAPAHQLYSAAVPAPLPSAYSFGGWFTDNSTFVNGYNFAAPVFEDITIYAKWSSVFIDTFEYEGENDFIKAIDYVNKNGSLSVYTLVVREDTDVSPQTISANSAKLLIKGESAGRKINLSANGVLFDAAGSGASLALENITLAGRSANTNAVVIVRDGAEFIMRTGSMITGNNSSAAASSESRGAAVLVTTNGIFNMEGGSITGNSSTVTTTNIVSGLFADFGAAVNLIGGSISGNGTRDALINHDAGQFTFSGTGTVGYLSLNAAAGSYSSVNIASGWLGNINYLNLRGDNAVMDTVKSYWVEKIVLKGTGAVSASGRINLSNFLSSAASANSVSAAGYAISFSGADIGKLLPDTSAVRVSRNGAASVGFADLASALDSIVNSGDYTVTLLADQVLAPRTLNAAGVNITLIGSGAEREIRLSANGQLFNISGLYTSLTIGNNITLVGRSAGGNGNADNNNRVVNVTNQGTFTMTSGSKITGNTCLIDPSSTSYLSSAVYVMSGSTFNMKGGSITGNAVKNETTINLASAVYIGDLSFMYFEGGSISGNSNGLGDILIHTNTSFFEISGTAQAGIVSLNFNNSSFTQITVNNSWSGNINILNLRSGANDIPTVISRWQNQKLIDGNGLAANIIKFQNAADDGLFISGTEDLADSIKVTHHIDNSGVLRAKHGFTFEVPPFNTGTPSVSVPSNLTLSRSGINNNISISIDNTADY